MPGPISRAATISCSKAVFTGRRGPRRTAPVMRGSVIVRIHIDLSTSLDGWSVRPDPWQRSNERGSIPKAVRNRRESIRNS